MKLTTTLALICGGTINYPDFVIANILTLLHPSAAVSTRHVALISPSPLQAEQYK
jgi:hypothetical protein